MQRLRKLFPVGVALFAAVLVFAGPPELRAEDRTTEVQGYVEALQSNNIGARITALKKITNSGLSDRPLFDSVQARLLGGYGVDPGNDEGVDEVSWMCKALASSGIPDYKDTLAKVAREAPSQKVRNYAQQSLGLVDGYAERNALLSKQTAETQGLPPEVARLVSMVRAPDPRLKKDAAKVITRSSFREPRLFDAVSEELLAGVKRSEDSDTLAWLCKALAASGDRKYRAVLEQVLQGAGDEKLRKYARQSLDTLQ